MEFYISAKVGGIDRSSFSIWVDGKTRPAVSPVHHAASGLFFFVLKIHWSLYFANIIVGGL